MKLLMLFCLLFYSCSRALIKSPSEAMRMIEEDQVDIVDDLDFATLKDGLKKSIEYWKKNSSTQAVFGPRVFTAKEYATKLEILYNAKDQDEFKVLVKEHFCFYEVYGRDRFGEILLTSYYEPVILGSFVPTDKYSQPLYKLPDDLVEVSLTEFRKISTPGVGGSRGKLTGRIENRAGFPDRVVPYYSRIEIDKEKKLNGKMLEMFWVDPLDAFFLHIQGSGTVLVDEKEFRIGYAGQNGREYVSIGKHMADLIPTNEMSLQKIEAHLRTLSKEAMEKFLFINPSYVFFKPLRHGPLTTSGADVYPGRTLAVDSSIFPLGSLAFLKFKKMVATSDKVEVAKDEEASRFVFAHDTGGAIKGPGRADLFWGRGDDAKLFAGHLRHLANLYFLVPK